MEYNIYLVDAFTDESFKGNPAGVVPNAKRLSGKEMQQIARELNASETAFVTSSDRDEYKIRFFSPYEEVKICGHSTLATFYILALRGYIIPIDSGIKSVYILFDNKKLQVDIYFYNYEIANIVVNLGRPIEDGIVKEDYKLLKTLNLELHDINLSDNIEAIPIIDFGSRNAFIPIKEKSKLDSIRIDKKDLEIELEKNDIKGVHLFYLPGKDSRNVYVRHFSTINNLNEDPATGTANGSLIYLLKTRGLIENDTITAIQGEGIGRRSNIYCHIKENDNTYVVEVGGKGKVVLEGIINVE